MLVTLRGQSVKSIVSISVSGRLLTYPSPNPTLTLTCYQLAVVRLGEGQMGSCPDTDIDPVYPLPLLKRFLWMPKMSILSSLLSLYYYWFYCKYLYFYFIFVIAIIAIVIITIVSTTTIIIITITNSSTVIGSVPALFFWFCNIIILWSCNRTTGCNPISCIKTVKQPII